MASPEFSDTDSSQEQSTVAQLQNEYTHTHKYELEGQRTVLKISNLNCIRLQKNVSLF